MIFSVLFGFNVCIKSSLVSMYMFFVWRFVAGFYDIVELTINVNLCISRF